MNKQQAFKRGWRTFVDHAASQGYGLAIQSALMCFSGTGQSIRMERVVNKKYVLVSERGRLYTLKIKPRGVA